MEHSIGTPLFWVSFIAVVLILLAIDLGVFHRRAHAVGFREATAWSVFWIVLSALFGLWISLHFSRQHGLEFFAGYLIEKALSVDNIFVFILIFSYFSVPARLHHRVLFWGILGALIMRALFIAAGAALIQTFHWVIYIFGAFLVFTGFKILSKGETEVDPQKNPVVRLFQKIVPMTTGFESGKFFQRHAGKIVATPLALTLVTVEVTDLVFAVDSIPAIFGITHDPFIIYTSNVCAILGLRALYFLLAAVVNRFVYLGTGLGIILMFIGVKMLLSGFFAIPIGLSLAFVAAILAGSIILSLLCPPKNP
ncbi:MAG: TerC family protein [Acidobacteriota bacterium]|nr:TerC family protein [Acidobacteriota bacterium]